MAPPNDVYVLTLNIVYKRTVFSVIVKFNGLANLNNGKKSY